MSNQFIDRDERTDVVENTSYRLAYLIMSFGLLIIVAYRGFFLQQSNWDLLALVILSGAIATLYQGINKVLSPNWVKAAVATFVGTAIFAAALVFMLR